jgi:hypothetical protein
MQEANAIMLFEAGLLDRARGAACLAFMLGGFALLVPSSLPAASSVTLVWAPSAGTNIAGYKIYYGATSGAYTNTVTAGNATNTTVSNLISGATYYFAATAYDDSNLESDLSKEVSYTNVVMAPPTITLTSPGNNATFTAPATISLAATVTANGHSVTRIQFYSGTTLLDEETNAPYVFTWSSVPAGIYSFTARLVYDASATLDSTPAVYALVAAARPQNAALTLVKQGNGTVSPDLSMTNVTFGHIYTITAIPADGQEFAGWTGDINSMSPRLTFMLTSNLVLKASFAPNPSASTNATVAGTTSITYNGLFYQDDAVRVTTAGSFTLSVTRRGKYSGRIQLGAKRYSFSKTLNSQLDGGTNTISRHDGPALTLDFHIGGTQADQISGHLTDGTWTSTLSGDRAVFGKANPAPFAGNYTLVVPGYDDISSLPAGDGFGTLKVSSAGKVQFVGTLADGTKVSQSASVSRSGYWPMYIPLYSGNGSLMSWLAFASKTNSDLSGTLSWIKPAGAKSKYYVGGFACDCDAFGSTYLRTDPILNLPAASLAFYGGSLTSGITNSITIAPRNKVGTPGKQLKLSFSASTGTFKGTFLDPASGKPLPFSGTVFQKLNTAYGALFGIGDQTSEVSLTP